MRSICNIFVVASAVLLMAAGGRPVCELPEHVKITVKPSTKEVVYDHSRTMADLQAQQTDTINPYGFDGVSVTQGFMEGAIELKPEVKLDYYRIPNTRAVCVFYDEININISIDPKITIAKEVWADRCMKKAVIGHETKHIMTDRKIVNKYGRTMGQKISDALSERGFIAGPVRQQDAQNVANKMQAVVFKLLEHEYKKMELDRAESQQAVDSRKEYDRVAALCPDFKVPKNAKDAAH